MKCYTYVALIFNVKHCQDKNYKAESVCKSDVVVTLQI